MAVATNFATTAQRLQQVFSAAEGHRLRLVSGSTGKLYAQITQGAPFDVLLAADSARPQRLEAEGLAVSGTRITYAVGTLVLWQPRNTTPTSGPQDTLKNSATRRIAIANPALAPYGLAAAQTLTRLGLLQSLQAKLVRGQNIGQAFAMVASGNAELGFVAASQLAERLDTMPNHRYWVVPADYHAPIAQQAVLLQRAADNTAARAFLTFLSSDRAQALIRTDRYRIDEPS